MNAVRRSSSLQLTISDTAVIDDGKLSEVSALSRSSSIYSNQIRSQCSEISRMKSCRLCIGCCRLRIASCLIGMISIALSVVTICCLLSVSGNLSKEVQASVTAPITSMVLFQIATALLLIIGILIDTHFLMVPFLLNTVIHIFLAVGIMVIVLLSSGDIKRLYGSHIFIICFVALALYVWFTVVVGMTILLIRNKRRLGYDHQDDCDTTRGAIDRISSSLM